MVLNSLILEGDNMAIKKKMTDIEPKVPEVKNIEQQDFMTPFDGQWFPSTDPILVGPKNFQTLVNMRYKKDGDGIEGVRGYDEFNNTAVSNFTNITTGVYFNNEKDPPSHLIIHGKNATDVGQILYSNNYIDEGGSFTAMYTDPSVSEPRFAVGPGAIVAYANGAQNRVWGGEGYSISAAFILSLSGTVRTIDDSGAHTYGDPKDRTDRLTATNDDGIVTFQANTYGGVLLMTTRPNAGFKVVVETANSNASNTTLYMDYWDGGQFVACSSVSDGTSELTQSGKITYSYTSGAEPMHYQGLYLYAYWLSIYSASQAETATISYVESIDGYFRPVSDVWDGVFRQPITVQLYDQANTTFEDFTLYVSEPSTTSTPVGCYIGAKTTNDFIDIMFEERMSAIYIVMLGDLVNTASTTIEVAYHNGVTTSGVVEVDNTNGFGASGLMYWEPPASTSEEKIDRFGLYGYKYRLNFNTATISGTNPEDVVIDLIYGIPASDTFSPYGGGFKFPALYKNKLMWCNRNDTNEGNRIDYSADNAPDVYNGENSSMNGFQSIYVGGVGQVTAATQLYNRFGSNIFSIFVICKDNEVWLMTGDSPLDYKLYPISFRIGCPAPYTLVTAEVGFNVGEDVERNIAMWISHQGPVMFDGAVIHPLQGLEDYFDPSNDNFVNFDYIKEAQSWFDSTYQEWNILLPTGTSTSPNTWLVYSVRLRKWFSRDVGDSQAIQCGITALDSNGRQRIAGGSDDGRVYLLEEGTSYNGDPITYTVTTGDFFPSGNQWDITTIRRLKFVLEQLDDPDSEVTVQFLADTNPISGENYIFYDVDTESTNSGTAGYEWLDVTATESYNSAAGYSFTQTSASNVTIGRSGGSERLDRTTIDTNQTAWSHAVKLTMTSAVESNGFTPLLWGFQWMMTRKDVGDSNPNT
jgi:hypothetical protein